MVRRVLSLMGASVVATAGLTATAYAAAPISSGGSAVRSAVSRPAAPVHRSGRFAHWDARSRPGAVTYDDDLVPTNARILVVAAGRRYTITLRVGGLARNQAYSAYVHRRSCGAAPSAAGEPYQNVADPVQPSVDPRYANRSNEVRLDLRTDQRGNAVATLQPRWTIRHGEANSIVLDSLPAGAGGRDSAAAPVGCLTIPF